MDAKATEKATAMVPARQPAPEPAALLQQALERGVSPEVLGQMLALHERWEASQARRAYTEAMSQFKARCPAVLHKDAQVKAGAASYRHATLGAIVQAITEQLSSHGLSVAWFTRDGEAGSVAVGCRVTHTAGHSEETWLSAPPDRSGNKNPIQSVGSTVTYLQRYTLLALLGLATGDQDDDGRASPPERSEPAQPQRQAQQSPRSDAPSAACLAHLMVCMHAARKRSGAEMPKVADAIADALRRHGDGALSAKYAGVLLGRAKIVLKRDGWKEPPEWSDERKERRAAAKQAELPAEEPEPQEPPEPEPDDPFDGIVDEPREREPGEEG